MLAQTASYRWATFREGRDDLDRGATARIIPLVASRSVRSGKRPLFFLAAITAGLVVSNAVQYREQQIDEAMNASLSFELRKVVPDSSSIPFKAGKIQDVNFSGGVANVILKNNNKFGVKNVTIGPDTKLFVYLPSRKRLFRLKQDDIRALLRGDKVAFLQDPSGKKMALILVPSQTASP